RRGLAASRPPFPYLRWPGSRGSQRGGFGRAAPLHARGLSAADDGGAPLVVRRGRLEPGPRVEPQRGAPVLVERGVANHLGVDLVERLAGVGAQLDRAQELVNGAGPEAHRGRSYAGVQAPTVK